MQGSSAADRELLDAAALCGHLEPPTAQPAGVAMDAGSGSLLALSPRDCHLVAWPTGRSERVTYEANADLSNAGPGATTT